ATHLIRVEPAGTSRETPIGDADATSFRRDEPTDPTEPTEPTGTITLTDVDDRDDWKATVSTATEAIRAGRAEKVVLAREVAARATAPFSPGRLARRLADRFAGCYVFSVDGLVGASPELLVERDGDMVRSQPMAGTTRRSDDPEVDTRLKAELFASPTYRHEHRLTIDMVHDTLLEFTSWLDFEPEPSMVSLANVTHLASRVEGRLSTPAASVLTLQDALHPTPAVSGRPRSAAAELIAELEERDRGRYAGTVGWADGAGNGRWAVTIRCAQIDPDDPTRARIHAGCGIVADSDPERELAESDAKLQAMLSVLED
ncbi:MAG: isochorismate synthase, partial [Actinobacteria bacterium]|nr:isochorismate synthase [Actinomycetota bacterium]